MRVFHIFSDYLPLTMIWAFQQIRNTPNCESHIAGLTYLPNSYSDSEFIYWPNPKYFFPKMFNWVIHVIFRKTKLFDLFLENYIKKASIELIHCHFGNIGADYAYIGQKLGIPTVVSFYGSDYGKIIFDKPRYRKAYHRMFEQASTFTCEGPFAAKKLENLGCPAFKIRLVRLGVDVGIIPFFSRKKTPGQLKMVQVATVTAKKGHLLGLDALERALEKGWNITLDLYGGIKDPRIAQQIQNRIQKPPLEGRVKFFGPLPYTELHAMLKEYHVFLQPSVRSYDGDVEGGAPIVLLDAQATGMPVLATTHCDIPFEVEHERTGLLVKEGDIEALASMMIRFAQLDQNAYDFFARESRKKMEQEFSISIGSAQLSAVYQELLNH